MKNHSQFFSEAYNIATLLNSATLQLIPSSESAKLDAEVLLAYVLNKPRSYLYTWPDKVLSSKEIAAYHHLISLRSAGQPIAYLIQQREFWSLPLIVSPDVLIPRPETELLVATALQLLAADQPISIADLGTGSGAISIALAHERPNWQIVAVDKSPAALAIASANAKMHQLNNIEFIASDWLHELKEQKFHAIISNPPYIAATDPHLLEGDVRFEPKSALIADQAGYTDLTRIIQQSPAHLLPDGWLLLEHGYQQAAQVQKMLQDSGFEKLAHGYDLAGIARITYGQLGRTY